jgi:hypothetical protein
MVIFAIVTVFLIWAINSLIPVVQSQIDSLVKNWPTIWKNSTNAVDELLHSPKFSGLRDSLQKQMTSLQKNFSKSMGSTVLQRPGEFNQRGHRSDSRLHDPGHSSVFALLYAERRAQTAAFSGQVRSPALGAGDQQVAA